MASAMNWRAWGVELDAVGPQLGAAPHPRHQRHHPDAQNEAERDDDAVGLFDDVVDQRIQQDQADEAEPEHGLALVPASGGNCHREGGRDHHGQDPGGIGARLGVHVRLEEDRDAQG
jgi:mono/diheme cytochrome c family protein